MFQRKHACAFNEVPRETLPPLIAHLHRPCLCVQTLPRSNIAAFNVTTHCRVHLPTPPRVASRLSEINRPASVFTKHLVTRRATASILWDNRRIVGKQLGKCSRFEGTNETRTRQWESFSGRSRRVFVENRFVTSSIFVIVTRIDLDSPSSYDLHDGKWTIDARECNEMQPTRVHRRKTHAPLDGRRGVERSKKDRFDTG